MRVLARRPFRWRGWRSRHVESLRYLVYLSNKHSINPYELLNSLIEAEKKSTVTCGPLRIVLRERAEDHAIFLLTGASKIVAQIRLRSGVWENLHETKRLYSMLVNSAQPFEKLDEQQLSIKELRKGMKNVDLRVRVTGKSDMVLRYSRDNGHPMRLCIATVTDPSGSIRLPLWNNQIDEVSVGDEIEVKNASVRTFRGLLYLTPARKRGELIMVKPSEPTNAKQTAQASAKRNIDHSCSLTETSVAARLSAASEECN